MGEMKFHGRPFKEGDETSIIQLYKVVTGRSRTLEEHRWEWLETAQGQGSMWVIEDISKGEIIGHHGLIPLELSFFNQLVLSGKTENTMVHPDYRGKIGYTKFEKQFLEEARSRFDLLFTTSGYGPPAQVRKRLGYFSIGGYSIYLKINRKQALDKITTEVVKSFIRNKLVGQIASYFVRLANFFIMPLFKSDVSIDKTITIRKIENIQEYAEDLENLWERNRPRLGITVNRDVNYLKWRFFDNPNLTYDFFLAYRQEKLVGYIVLECNEVGQAIIDDLIADQDDDAILNTIVQEALRIISERGIHTVIFPTLKSNNWLNQAIQRNGFKSFAFILKLVNKLLHKEETLLYIKLLNDQLDEQKARQPENWYFTSTFFEGLRHASSVLQLRGGS